MDILNLLNDKTYVVDFLLKTIDSNIKNSEGLRNMNQGHMEDSIKLKKSNRGNFESKHTIKKLSYHLPAICTKWKL